MNRLQRYGGLAALLSGLVPGVITGTLAQTTLPTSFRVATGVDTGKPGYLIRTYQADGVDNNGNISTVERLLAGDLGPNIANLGDPNYTFDAGLGAFIVNQAVNFRGDAGENSDNGIFLGPELPDALIPGLPGSTGSTEQAAAEAIAFLEFPSAGTYEFAVQSDDAFKLSVGINPRDRFATTLRQFSGERSMAESRVILVNITEPGIYPFRCVWANRLGGSGWEWYLYDNGTPVAVGASGNRVKTYWSGPLRPYVASIFPESGAVGVSPTTDVVVSLRDDSIALDGASVKLSVAGASGPVTGTLKLAKDGARTTATFTPTASFEVGKSYTNTLVYSDQGSPALSRTNTWSFTISEASVAAAAAIPAAQVDTKKTGFRLFVHQLDGTQADNGAGLDTIRNQLSGLLGSNQADLSGADADGYFYFNTPDRSVINLNNLYDPVEVGNFTSTNGFPDLTFPGTPGTGGLQWTADNLATEVTTLLEFPKAGSYTLGIFGIDSFSVAIGDGRRSAKDLFATVLADYDGDITQNYLFSFYVPTPGFYPVRLIHNIGIKQGDLEFFSANADGTNLRLINAPGGLKAYQPQGTWPAYVRDVSPGANIAGLQDITTTDVLPNAPVTAHIVDDGTTVSPGSVTLRVDGAGSSVATKDGNVTTVTFTRGADFLPNTSHTATLVYTDSAGTTVTNEWKFEIVDAFVVDAARSYPLGSGDSAKRGFSVRTAQLGIGFVSGENGSVTKSEGILAGNYFGGVNDANYDDATYPFSNGWWQVQAVNFGTGSQGSIPSDTAVPGIPGKSGRTDHYAAEILTYIEFPKAGVVQFAVHSDDSPRIMQQEAQSHDYGNIEIVEPCELKGTRIAMSATRTAIGSGFGAALPAEIPIVAGLAVANPLLGNAALVNAAECKDKVVILQRGGGIAFGLKASVAKAAGAKAVIIYNDNSGDRANRPPIFMGGTAEGVNIPCLFINYRDGTNLVALAQKGPVTLSLRDNPAQQALVPNDGYYGGWTYSVYVEKPGLYPFRFVSGNGGGDYSIEWTVIKSDGTRVLLNDPNDPEALRTFRAVTTAPVLLGPVVSDAACGVVDISWRGMGTLLRSDSIAGPWTRAADQSMPHKVVSGASGFYRVEQAR